MAVNACEDRKRQMLLEYSIAGAVTIALAAYLFYALLFPEKF